MEWIDYDGEDLEIPVGGVHLWLLEPSSIYERYLDSAELLRYERILNPGVRSSYSCAQGGLRRLAGIYMERPPEQVTMRRQAHGKPYVEGAPEFNLSHTCGRTIAAFSREAIGIDVEAASRAVHADELAQRFFFPEETTQNHEHRSVGEKANISSLLGLQGGDGEIKWRWHLSWSQTCPSGLSG